MLSKHSCLASHGVYLLQAVKAMTSADEEVCERFVKTELHSDMLENLDRQPANQSFAQAQLDTLHSVVRRYEPARKAFRQREVGDAIQRFRDFNESTVPSVFSYFMTD